MSCDPEKLWCKQALTGDETSRLCWTAEVKQLVKDWHSIRPTLATACHHSVLISATKEPESSSFSDRHVRCCRLNQLVLTAALIAKGLFPLLFSRRSYVQHWEISLQRPASKHPTAQLHQSVAARLLAFVHWEQREHMNEQRLQPAGKHDNLTLNAALVTNVSRKTHMLINQPLRKHMVVFGDQSDHVCISCSIHWPTSNTQPFTRAAEQPYHSPITQPHFSSCKLQSCWLTRTPIMSNLRVSRMTSGNRDCQFPSHTPQSKRKWTMTTF